MLKGVGIEKTIVKLRRMADEDRTGHWLAATPEERIRAVGIINLTIEDGQFASQRLERVFQVSGLQRR